MTICEHCGARVYGNVCEYCDMPVNNSVPPQKIAYKQTKQTTKKPKNKISNKKSLSTLSLPIKIKKKHKKRKFKPNKRFYIATAIVGVLVICMYNNISMKDNYTYYEPITTDNYEELYYNSDYSSQEDGVFQAGTYQIGEQFPEGTYIFLPNFTSGNTGTLNIYSDLSCQYPISQEYSLDGERIVEVTGDNCIKFSYATAYNLDMHPEIVNSPQRTDGMFIVGRDIDEGTYTLKSKYSTDSEWNIYSSVDAIYPTLKSSGLLIQEDEENNSEQNDNQITLEYGDILELKDCLIDENISENEYYETPELNDQNQIFNNEGIFPDGTYKIGTEFPEGLYIFVPTLSDNHAVEGIYSDPECKNQISSEYVHFDGTRIAKISGDGYVDFSWATAYNLDMHPELVNDPHKTEGMFIVGRDIEAGTYELEETNNSYGYAEWYIYSDLTSIGGPIKKDSGSFYSEDEYNSNVTNIITLEDGDIFELKGCRIKE